MSQATRITVAASLAAAALLAACDKKPGTPPKPQSQTVAAANISSGIVTDPSVPPASQVLGEQPAPAAAGQDSTAQAPKDDLRKEEESNTMPKALQGNNHSSTSLDAAQKQKQEAAYESLVQKLDNEPPR